MNGRATVSIVRKRIKRLSKLVLRPSGVRVGFPSSKVKKAVIERAIYNEFGTRTIPERPFFRNALRNNRKKYRRYLEDEGKNLLQQPPTVKTVEVFSKLGIIAQGDIQHEITVLVDPPLAPSTIRNKGSSKPLIDTGELRASVTWELIT